MKKHIFENDQVCVFTTILNHNQPLKLRGASHIVVGLTPGQLQHFTDRGDPSILDIEPQGAYWVGDLPICSYQKPLEVMIIEMKTPQSRPLPSIPID